LLVFKVLVNGHENIKVRFGQGKKPPVGDPLPAYLNDR